MPTQRTRYVFCVYSIIVSALSLLIWYVRGPEHMTRIEDYFMLPGAFLAMLLCPGCVHSGAPLELIIAILNILAYLATPLLAAAVFKWWRHWNEPWTPPE